MSSKVKAAIIGPGNIGTDLLMICSNVSPKAIGGIQRAAEDLFELTELAAKQGLRVAYEALSGDDM